MDILFVEDEELARVGMIPMLEERGHNVDVATNCDEALERLREKPYGLILLDIMLEPGKVLEGIPFREAGKELLLRLRRGEFGELPTDADVPVVAITAVSDMDISTVLNSEGRCAHVLLKPIDPDDAINEMSDLL